MPILDPHSLEFISRGAEYTRRVGMRLGILLGRGDVVCLAGDLGSGKTTFIQGLAAGWGSADAVSSPTFVIVNEYRRTDGERIFHLDAYRLQDGFEAQELDFERMITSGLLVIEWADRIPSVLPAEHLWVSLRHTDSDQRDLIFTARGQHYDALLASFQKRLYGGL